MKKMALWLAPLAIFSMLAMSADRAVAQAPAPGAPAAAEKTVMIKNVYGLEANARLRTPVYQVNGGGKIVRATGNVIREWVQVVAEYLVASDPKSRWFNQVTFQFYVLTAMDNREMKTKDYTIFRGQVAYSDVDRLRRDARWATLYLRPTAVPRYGEPIAVAVEVSVDGRIMDTKMDVARPYAEMLSREKEWWKNPKLPVKDGYLLKASDTPFAFINVDDFEEIAQ
jgi:hypothetical protein